MTARSGIALAIALAVLAGCEPEARPLVWRIRFATPELAERAASIEARIVRGMCAGTPGEVVYAAVFELGEAAPVPALLGPGAYRVEAYGRDESCIVFAGDCQTLELPAPNTEVELVLQVRPDSPTCEADQRCVGGQCETEAMPDAGPGDAGDTDAGPPDAGFCPSEDAVDGTGTRCANAADCADRMICHGQGLLFVGGACTTECSDDADCVPGWHCERAPENQCSGGCPDAPICQCEGFPGFSEEVACDGRDGDCDGRVDEAPPGSDLCGNGVCACGRCICDPGYTACGSSCVDTEDNARHCGACGNPCDSGFVCAESRCVCNRTLCSGECVDTDTDESNCGRCGVGCGTGFTCGAGHCNCPDTVCGPQCVDVATDEANCGSCGSACAAGQLCCAGSCVDAATCP